MRWFHPHKVHRRCLINGQQTWSANGTPNSLTHFVRAVVLLVSLAELALKTGTNLSTNTNTVSDLDGGHLAADLDCFANDFVANANW